MGRVAEYMTPAATLPSDGAKGVLVGRVWRPDVGGPSVVAIRHDGVYDISALAPTVRDLCEDRDAVAKVRTGKGEQIGALDEILANTPEGARDPGKPRLLAPIDLQAIKAAGVTFPLSMLERVIEEQARGAPQKAEAIPQEHPGPNLAATSAASFPAVRRPSRTQAMCWIEQGCLVAIPQGRHRP